jgi:hypothetical protein
MKFLIVDDVYGYLYGHTTVQAGRWPLHTVGVILQDQNG